MIDNPVDRQLGANLDASAWAGSFVLSRVDVDGYYGVLHNLLHVVVDSVPLMRSAIDVLGDAPVEHRPLLSDYLARHVVEETDHDRWLEADIAAMYERFDLEPQVPVHEALRELMAFHWRMLDEGSVYPLLGHMWALESRPPSGRQLAALRTRLDLDESMTRTYDRHAEDDQEHRIELSELLARVCDDEARARAACLGANVTAVGVIRFWCSLERRH